MVHASQIYLTDTYRPMMRIRYLPNDEISMNPIMQFMKGSKKFYYYFYKFGIQFKS